MLLWKCGDEMEEDKVYALIYNKTPADQAYPAGSVVSASLLNFRYSGILSTGSACYDDSIIVTGTWEVCGYLPENETVTCLYVKVS